MEPVWQATTTTRAMLVAIWTAYPELDTRDGTELLNDWQITKSLWQWAQAWRWTSPTSSRLIAALTDAADSLVTAAGAVAHGEASANGGFKSALHHALSIVQAASSGIARHH
jgi:hypothetical protein